MHSISKNLLLATFSLSSLFTFSSCDSSPATPETEFTLSSRGIDVAAVTANPASIAEMPAVLLPGETINHADANHLTIRNVSQLGAPMVINSTGGVDLDNIALQYSKSEVTPTSALFRLASKNAFPADDPNIRDDFQARMDSLIQASAQANGASIQAALGEPTVTNNTWRIVLQAARSIGILTALGPEPDGPDTELPLVLVNRVITYTVTSTNQTLLDSNTISGTYVIEDRWAIPQLFAVEEGTIAANNFDQISLRFNPMTMMLITQDDLSIGTFTITLNNL